MKDATLFRVGISSVDIFLCWAHACGWDGCGGQSSSGVVMGARLKLRTHEFLFFLFLFYFFMPPLRLTRRGIRRVASIARAYIYIYGSLQYSRRAAGRVDAEILSPLV